MSLADTHEDIRVTVATVTVTGNGPTFEYSEGENVYSVWPGNVMVSNISHLCIHTILLLLLLLPLPAWAEGTVRPVGSKLKVVRPLFLTQVLPI